MPCRMLPQVHFVSLGLRNLNHFGIEHDIRSLELHVVPSYRSAEHEFQNLAVVQGSNRLLPCFSVEKDSCFFLVQSKRFFMLA